MSWDSVPLLDRLRMKTGGLFIIRPCAGGFALAAHRPGEPSEETFCATPGLANQRRLPLSDAGLCGFIEGAE